MTSDLFICSYSSCGIKTGGKIISSCPIQIKVKNDKTKTNELEILFRTKL